MDMKLHEGALGDADRSIGWPKASSIGEILVDAGYLNPEDAETIAKAQRENGLSFGEAAVKLKLLTMSELEFALSRQFGYPYLINSTGALSASVISAFQPTDPFVEQMRSLRTRLSMWRAANPAIPPTIAIVSPESGEGRSFVAANLAVVFSQMGERTLLIDADMRKPKQDQLFNLTSRLGLSNLLLGRAGPECITKVPHFFDLSVLQAGSTPPNPQELLTRARLGSFLREVVDSYDIVIIDTPPASLYADTQIIAARAGASVMVTRGAKTDAKVLSRVCFSLRDCGANLVGAVYNDG